MVLTVQPRGVGVGESVGVVEAEGVGRGVGLREKEGVGEGVVEGLSPRGSVAVGVGVAVGGAELEPVEVVVGVGVEEGGCRKRTRPLIPLPGTLESE
jgi:hypothetical protein